MTNPLDGPPPANEAPEDSYTPATISSMQNVSQASIGLGKTLDTQNLLDLVGDSFITKILSGFASIGAAVGQALNDIANALFGGLVASDHPALDKIRDGQLDLVARLDDVSGYAVAYMTYNRYKDRNKWNRMEFDGAIISNPKNAAYVDNGIQLAKGTWFIDAQVTHDQHVDRLSSRIRIVVTRPNGTVFSIKESYAEVLPNKYTTLSVRHSVSVPGAGYRVHVWAWYNVGSAFGVYNRLLYRGGTALTHLMVDRINLDATEESTQAETVPTIGDQTGDDG